MATNSGFRPTLRASDLKEGQTLIAVMHLGFSLSTHSETVYRIDKKLKTRLVLTPMREAEGELVPMRIGLPLRVIIRDDTVTDKVEGRSSRDGISLYTEDDEDLAQYRVSTGRNQIRRAARDTAENASRRLSKETAEAAIQALQSYLDNVVGTDDE